MVTKPNLTRKTWFKYTTSELGVTESYINVNIYPGKFSINFNLFQYSHFEFGL